MIADLFYNGNEAMVTLDTPTREQVASLNSGGLRLNSAGESVGSDGDFGGRRRRSRSRRRLTATDVTTPRDDNGDALTEASKDGDVMSADTPADMPEETAADGKRTRHRRRSSKTGDVSTDTKNGSGDTPSTDPGSTGTKDSGAKDRIEGRQRKGQQGRQRLREKQGQRQKRQQRRQKQRQRKRRQVQFQKRRPAGDTL